MSAWAIACSRSSAFFGALAGLALRALPEHHMSADSKDVVKVVTA
jgi:hypothetical protein